MQKALAELAEALRERLAIIADEESRRAPVQHTERLREVSERIEQIEQGLPATIDPQLRHFLQRRSYSKALELLVTERRG
jgi:vacuolar-type H+-ATPase catalytic subunit A/Vma1